MCGIAGLLGPSEDHAAVSLQAMTDAITYRGPDAEGHWFDEAQSVGLGHRRLSILDLSEAGAQPMQSRCGRFVIVFNGEIYNHLRLRRELEAASEQAWRGHSDTETLLAGIVAWGLEETLRRAKGMFALALWDLQTNILSLARDRMGEKPLYFSRLASGWAFASELKALLEAPGLEPELSASGIRAYLEFGYVPEGLCIFEGVEKVAPGHIVTLSRESSEAARLSFEVFTDLAEKGLSQRGYSDGQSETVLLDKLAARLEEVVDEQSLSDVPLGAFLSGGVDSSLITSLMQAQSQTQVRSFSIGFGESRFNEAPYAAAVAKHLGTAHTEFILSQEDALDLVPSLPQIYDEPFADSSQIPTALLCREARKAVTVALSGDGGDEVFGGYNRHVVGPGLWARAQRVPKIGRKAGARLAAAIGPFLVSEASPARRVAKRFRLPITAVDKLARLAPGIAAAESFEDFYRTFSTTFAQPSEVLTNGAQSDGQVILHDEVLARLTPAEQMMAWDSVSYLPGDILVKVDRAAMHASLETRAPFLDARVVEAAWALPMSMKIRDGVGKVALRRLLDRHVPRSLIDRPKQGFSIPLDQWLRMELRGWAERLLSQRHLFALASLSFDPIERLWQQHLKGRANNGQKLWTVLMLLAWLEANEIWLSKGQGRRAA
ncbi:asparagine synthase (glutamine-hydrolyzing) [Thioclava sp. L04-15]|uniref:asparagine synthase (glutamine-hydrolyzing) n=1 Tax=Thioclava sp. L04-15 TaxID=1915318 RepID=UPI0009966CE1|nr:asparagine synthase (glutamine-hydrolyzing) [Thioclava sp. L04-15]OOY27836.1 asparagine synthase (glutamine-hydrolyzing) [Thioclava sp. L04-15]